jgi:hypothetical protein
MAFEINWVNVSRMFMGLMDVEFSESAIRRQGKKSGCNGNEGLKRV